MKDPVFMVRHIPTVKARESAGRDAKPAVQPRKFVAHKKTLDFENETIIQYMTSKKVWFINKIQFCFKMIIGCDSSMTGFILH